jgi:hypothetical protein
MWLAYCRESALADTQGKYDAGDGDTGCQLLGAGRKIRKLVEEAAATDTLEEHLATLSRGQQESEWSPEEVSAETSKILRYTSAHISGIGIIDSFSYGRVKSKQSFWVLVQYEVSGEIQFWVAKVTHFLKLGGEGKEDLRVAVATLFAKPRKIQKGFVYVIKEDQIHQESYAIAMSSIVCTLVSCVVKDPRAEEKRGPRNTDWFDWADAGKVFLVRSANTSRFN